MGGIKSGLGFDQPHAGSRLTIGFERLCRNAQNHCTPEIDLGLQPIGDQSVGGGITDSKLNTQSLWQLPAPLVSVLWSIGEQRQTIGFWHGL
jgi:hypothetical protein